MDSKWYWKLLLASRRLWLRAVLFSVAGIATAVLAVLLKTYIPSDLPAKIGADAVGDILGIIASSMLAVTTFTLSIMVQAFAGAAKATPRATRLLIEDPTSQNVLATFLGSFLFALVGIIALRAGIYGESGRVLLFAVTLIVVALIVYQLIRWFDHLTQFGRLDDTSERVENATLAAIEERRAKPFLGCRPLRNIAVDLPTDAVTLIHPTIGYVQHIDTQAMQTCAKERGGQVFILALPGTFVDARRPVLGLAGAFTDADHKRLCEYLTVGHDRTFDQDPRFGLCVLAEIACRALSPGFNDAGTAIAVIGRLQRLITAWGTPDSEIVGVHYPALYAPPLRTDDLIDDAFFTIARDGAGMVEVSIRMQKALATLAASDSPDVRAAAFRMAIVARERAMSALSHPIDRQRIAAATEFAEGSGQATDDGHRRIQPG